MNRALLTLSTTAGLCLLAPSAFAHAFLDHAVPGVGSTVAASPSELTLDFTQNIEAPLCRVSVSGAGGATVAVPKPTKDQSDASVLHVRLGKPLAPGTYIVTWHVVSVDTHPTSGSYKFTIAP